MPLDPPSRGASTARLFVGLCDGAAVHWRVQGHVLVESDRGARVLQRFGGASARERATP